ncbi:hypothetical protein [Novispirillum itersonii]|uniref:Uncharacterized protein n=1 Tax=Novispirillum itersonii TaxID=189 RepID=A0A7W9ZGD6_NOVIT|nr:hypothetical protein [Novispirillum itersonii]MBB6210740.1 hypothetical protein [Novispirillum itersonii]
MTSVPQPTPMPGPRCLSGRPLSYALFAIACAALMVWGKYAWLHNDAAAEACALGAKGLDCTLRPVLGELMYRKVFAWVAIAVSALAVLRPKGVTVIPAVVTSTFALAFYNADPGAFAAALTVVAIARCR